MVTTTFLPTRLANELPPQRENFKLNGVEKVRDLLVGAGLDEVITYSLNSPLDEAKLRLQTDASESTQIGLLNPLSQERSHLRQTLLVGLLQTASVKTFDCCLGFRFLKWVVCSYLKREKFSQLSLVGWLRC